MSYIASGFDKGHRDELTEGGLIRSLGGWSEIARTHLKRSHTKSDERILGESTFVSDVLSQANEKYERKYELKRLGYDLNRVAVKVSEIYDIDVDDFLSRGKQQKKVKARSLFCYWAVNDLVHYYLVFCHKKQENRYCTGYEFSVFSFQLSVTAC